MTIRRDIEMEGEHCMKGFQGIPYEQKSCNVVYL